MTRPAGATTLALVTSRFVAPELLAPGPGLCLLGGRHRTTGRVVFPCPTEDETWEAVELPTTGVIWSWTVQRFAPKSPPYEGKAPFEPFALGYIELPGAVIVESRLTGAPLDSYAVGQPVELTTLPFRIDPDGAEVLTFAFCPVGATR